MIAIGFEKNTRGFVAVTLSGHAGFAAYGRDVACAAVTSAVQMAANGITQVLSVPAAVDVAENRLDIRLPPDCDGRALDFMRALYLHLDLLTQDYSQNIRITVTEV